MRCGYGRERERRSWSTLIQEMTHDLADDLERHGYSSIEEIRGIARNRIVEHSQIRRNSGNYTCGYVVASFFMETALRKEFVK